MRIAYMTSDEVNRALAGKMAARYGAVVCNPVPKHVQLAGDVDGVLWNLDDVPKALRAALLEGLCHSAPDHPVAVHGYDLTDEQLNALRRNGIAATRRLEADLFRSLCKAVRRRRATVLANDTPTELTWVNVVK